MKPFKNYDTTETYGQKEQLPIGGYILKIMDARISEGNGERNDQLIISFDIAEGPFMDFYARNYRAQTGEDKKWKGVARLWCPDDSGSEADDRTKRRFKTNIEAFEESNEGYSWDWDEKKLKGLRIGGVFNRKEYDFQGHHGFFTNFKWFVPVEQIENGSFKQPGDDYLDNHNVPEPAENDGFMNLPDDLEERLPFA